MLGVAVPCILESRAQTEDAYAAVPEVHREALRQLVREMTALQKQRQWHKVYDMMPVSSKTESRDDFARHQARSSRLIDFDVDAVTQSPAKLSEWMIAGCAVFELSGKRKALRSTMFATLSNAHWNVSPVFIVAREHGGYMPCDSQGH